MPPHAWLRRTARRLFITLPGLAALAIPLAPGAARAAADSVVVFNEVQYHPADEAAESEWLELRNLMGVDVDMSRWSLRGGIEFVFPEGTVIPGRGVIVLAADPSDPALAGASPLGPFTGRLANGGETLELLNNDGRVMDRLEYGDSGDWPVGADGSGATLARRDQESADNRPSNWTASREIGGTPGRPNVPLENTPPVVTTVSDFGAEWRFEASDAAPPSDWRAAGFDDGAWGSGPGLHHAGDAALSGVGEGLEAWWPLDDGAGTTAANTVAGAPDGTLRNGVTWYSDPLRGTVARFDGADGFIDAGSDTIPRMTTSNDFTWAFWGLDEQGANNNVIVGNRYSPTGGDWSPREFIKFTTNQFEFHRNGGGENLDYGPITQNAWVHHVVVKEGATLTYYRNGTAEGSTTITQGLENPQPLYFGGDQTAENWAGRLDDVALWSRALSPEAVAGLADGTFTPATAPSGGVGSPLVTELPGVPSTAYFRRAFAFTGAASRTSMALRLLVDDGAVVFLNGTEIHRANLPAGPVAHGATAVSPVGDAAPGETVHLDNLPLVRGENVLAVQVHQHPASASDLVFGLEAVLTEQPPLPGGDPASLVISELSGAGDSSFRIELLNAGASPVDLAGFALASSGGAAAGALPAGVLAPGEFAVIAAASLGLDPARGDRLFLTRAGGAELVDARQVAGTPRARTGSGEWWAPDAPTFGAANTFSIENDVVINEIMFNPRPIQATPDMEGTYDEVVLLDWGATWRYNESGEDLGANWAGSGHPVGGNWGSGPGPLGWDTSAPPVPIATELNPPATNNPRVVTYWFESDFSLTAAQIAELARLEILYEVDDGAVFHLNGVEFHRFAMPEGPVGADTLSTGVGDAALSDPIAVPLELLVEGTNRLSVSVHQNTPGSSDVVFGARLQGLEELTPFIPGQPFRNSDDQWIELLNRGAGPIDLSGWRFDDGIDFAFPSGTVLESGEFLVIARQPNVVGARVEGALVLGPWDGSLSRQGERLRLVDASGNPADEVRFADGGRWASEADGGGASLELRDPDADNGSADAWAASDEAHRGSWTEYRYRGRATNGQGDPTQYHEFVFGLLEEGEILIDDIEVIENPDGTARPLIQNGTFDEGTTDAWRLLGTHRHAEVVDDPEQPGNKVLRLAASGATEHMHNHAETTLKSGASYVTINSSLEYEIRFRARWVSGSNQLHTRLYFNRLARTTLLEIAEGGGTPGAPNSRRVPNAGPTFGNLSHSPAVPAAGQPATVGVDVRDPDGVGPVSLRFSVDGGPFQSVAMMPAGDGDRFEGVVPAQGAGTKVQFYVEAEDSAAVASTMPAAGPESRALIPWDDGQADLDYGDCQPTNFRIVMTDADTNFLHEVTNVMSNDRLGCTIIHDEKNIWYDCGVRLKGSQRGRAKDVRVGFNVSFPDDRPFLGAHETVAVDRSGAGDQFSQKEILVKHAINHAGGIPGMYDDLIRVIAPRPAHTGSAMLLKSRFDREWMENKFPNGEDGRHFEYELIYYPTSTTGGVEGLKRPNPDNVTGVAVRNLGGDDKELYRWHWLIKNNRDADDYAGLVDMLTAMGLSGSAYREATDALLDVDQWLRAFAVQILFGVADNYASGSQHNMMVYIRPTDGKAMYFPWDMDFTFSSGSTDLTPNSDLDRLIAASPANERAYYGHVRDIVETTFNREYMTRWAEHYSCFLPRENLTGFLSTIASRAASALSQVNSAVRPVDFGITTPDGGTTGGTSTAIRGDGWVDVHEIRLAGGGPLAVEWLDDNSWEVVVPVAPGANQFTLEAYDRYGALIGSSSVTVTGTGSVVPARAPLLAVSEVHYHPRDPDAAEMAAGFADDDAFEFVEFVNTSDSVLSLEGVRFTAGITFDLPAVTLGPGEFLVVPRDLAGFRMRHGDAATVTAGFGTVDGNRLDNGGERLTVLAADGSAIADFVYGDDEPWPSSADGHGYSLVLQRPGLAPNPADPSSWRSSTLPDGNPGSSDARGFTGTADGDANGNGLPDLVDHVLGIGAEGRAPRIDLVENPAPIPSAPLFLRAVVDLAAEDATVMPEVSPGLGGWTDLPEDAPPPAVTDLGAGFAEFTWPIDPAAAGAPDADRFFARLRALLRE